MSTAQATSNKATCRRLHDAVNSGDVELVSKMIDEVVEPDVRIRTPLPVEVTGAQALKQVWAPDLWLKDDPGDPGSNAWAGRFWDSPDLWIRNEDDGGTMHEAVEHGQDNWFYARVRNRSATTTARHFLVTFNVKPFAGVDFANPTDFLPCIATAAGFDLAPGASTIVEARSPAALVPPVGTHACWLAAVLTRSDQPSTGLHVWEHNYLAQKNLAIVDLVPDTWFIFPFVISRLPLRRPPVLELVRPRGLETLQASLVQRSGAALGKPQLAPVPDASLAGSRLDCGAPALDDLDAQLRVLRGLEGAPEVAFEPGPTAQVRLTPTPGQLALGLRVHVPANAKPGQELTLDLLKRDGKRVVGGIALQVRVVQR